MKLIDRYILRFFVSTLLFALVALCVIFLIVNLLENLDTFLDHNASFKIIAKYYIHFFPDILKLLTPVATLLATLFSIGRLSTLNEITAMKSGGMSLYRLMLMPLIFTIALSFFQLYFNGWVVPVANEKKHEIEAKYLRTRQAESTVYNLYFRDTPTNNITIQYYDSDNQTGSGMTIEEFTKEMKPRLLKRIEAKNFAWDTASNGWKLNQVTVRTYSGEHVKTMYLDTMHQSLNLTRSDIEKIKKSDDEMNFDERKEYIQLLQMGGKDVRKQLIDYYGEYAFPFANVIVILFGVPFASVRRKGGIAIQIAAAMVISFAYMISIKFTQTLSYNSPIDPILAGWISNIIFLILGLFTIFRTKT